MATANDVIRGALRLLGCIATGEEPTAAEARDGLDALNQMIAALELDGVRLGLGTLGLAGNLDVPAGHVEGIKHLLAVKLAAEYERPPSPIVAAQADSALRALQAHYGVEATLTIDDALLIAPSRQRSPS